MKHLCNTYKSHVIICTLASLALFVVIIVQSKDSKSVSNFFYFPSPLWFWSNNTSHVNHGTISSYDPLLHSLAIINNSSSLSKSEEKRQRALDRVRNSIEEVLKWRKKDENIKEIEIGLASARKLIKKAIRRKNNSTISHLGDVDYVPQGNIYKNAFVFHRSYLLMEKMFKMYVYEEGEPPLFHYGPTKNIYSMEGIFMNSMEANTTNMRTYNASEAHAFFLPFSVVMILQHLFDPIVRDKAVLERTIVDYVGVISNKYPYWNRSLGVDHFMLSCHDWGPRATSYHPLLYFHSIRALCNANTSENFNPRKDLSIPEINLPTGELPTLVRDSSPSQRTVLAFFAGRMHGHIRPMLLKHWKGKDEEMHIYEQVPEGISYADMMKESKYCLCPSGWEVASPRIPEAIYAECVPVLISQNYVPPFSDVLNWDSFSVQVPIEEIANLKKILMDIPDERYLQLKEGVKQVQRHFMIRYPPKRYDVFHMIIHSIWLRRLNVQVHG